MKTKRCGEGAQNQGNAFVIIKKHVNSTMFKEGFALYMMEIEEYT